MDDLVTITAELYSCSDCGALVLPEFRACHERWHEALDEARWQADAAIGELGIDRYAH
jgi:hypothetical protein